MKVARLWLEELPERTQEGIKKNGMKGPLISFSSDNPEAGPDAEDLKKYVFWVRPVLKIYRNKSPSTYLLGDALVEMNKELGGGLFPVAAVDLVDTVLGEANAIRKMCSKVRELYRNHSTSRDPVLSELKSLLVKRATSTELPASSSHEYPLQESGLPAGADNSDDNSDDSSDDSTDSSKDNTDDSSDDSSKGSSDDNSTDSSDDSDVRVLHDGDDEADSDVPSYAAEIPSATADNSFFEV